MPLPLELMDGGNMQLSAEQLVVELIERFDTNRATATLRQSVIEEVAKFVSGQQMLIILPFLEGRKHSATEPRIANLLIELFTSSEELALRISDMLQAGSAGNASRRAAGSGGSLFQVDSSGTLIFRHGLISGQGIKLSRRLIIGGALGLIFIIFVIVSLPNGAKNGRLSQKVDSPDQAREEMSEIAEDVGSDATTGGAEETALYFARAVALNDISSACSVLAYDYNACIGANWEVRTPAQSLALLKVFVGEINLQGANTAVACFEYPTEDAVDEVDLEGRVECPTPAPNRVAVLLARSGGRWKVVAES